MKGPGPEVGRLLGSYWPVRHPHPEVIRTTAAAVGCIPGLDAETSNTLAEEHGEIRLGLSQTSPLLPSFHAAGSVPQVGRVR